MTLKEFVDNKITKWTAILVFCGIMFKGTATAWGWADDRWDQRTLLAGAGYATEQRVEELEEYVEEQSQHIQKSVDKNFLQYQVQQYQDDVDEIKDMEIDGTVEPSDLKKKHRYETRIRDIQQQIQQQY